MLVAIIIKKSAPPLLHIRVIADRHVNCFVENWSYRRLWGEKRELCMRSATKNEIEYLHSINGDSDIDARMVDEMARRLDALRQFDQNFCQADWRPEHNRRVPLPNAMHAGS